MIYSSWVPDRGGYRYYEATERLGLSDDLPIPRLKQSSPIGVASTSIGRPLPPGSKLIGEGPLARGSIVPLDRTGLSGITEAAGDLKMWALGVVSLIAGAWAMRRWSK